MRSTFIALLLLSLLGAGRARAQAEASAGPSPSSAPDLRAPAPPAEATSWVDHQAAGEWVYASRSGWLWIPDGTEYAFAVPGDDGSPYAYAYQAGDGWAWLPVPWDLGLGSMSELGERARAHGWVPASISRRLSLGWLPSSLGGSWLGGSRVGQLPLLQWIPSRREWLRAGNAHGWR